MHSTKRNQNPNPQPSAIARERRRQIRGLLLLALAAILFAILRAGPHAVFNRGWWRLW
jgi:hypothetical protein